MFESKSMIHLTTSLFCFPFAGGNVYSYRPLAQNISPTVPVVTFEPPGRGRRGQEPRLTDIDAMASDLTSQLAPSIQQPYALFGHSMGALVIYLATHKLMQNNLPLPRHLFLSGKSAPDQTSVEARWYTLPLEEFKQKLITLGGCPPAVCNDRELMEYFAPIIRDDMRVVAEYQHTALPPLPVPITVLIGDQESTTCEQAWRWKCFTNNTCNVVTYPGGHFFLFDHIDVIGTLIQATLAEA